MVEVDLVDFAFEGLPASVDAGTRLTITNSSENELHKLSALPIPADEDRPVEELLALPGAELGAILRVRPATVLTAGPGGPQVDEVGDGTLNAPGRYVIICAVPDGLDPDEYLDALSGTGRPPMTGAGRRTSHWAWWPNSASRTAGEHVEAIGLRLGGARRAAEVPLDLSRPAASTAASTSSRRWNAKSRSTA